MVPSDSHVDLGADLPADLAEIVAVWSTLSGAVRDGVFALIRAAR